MQKEKEPDHIKILQSKLSTVPNLPGIYFFKNKKEQIIYVGKAKGLRNRLKSYFSGLKSLDIRKSSMVKEAVEFSFLVTDNEVEALALEASFIKQYKPRFNIILRDDKNYPYLRITINEKWPLVEIVRNFKRDGSVYFGPYVSSRGMRETLDFVRKHFPIRICKYNLENITKECLQYQIGNCGAPCTGKVDKEEYMAAVNDAIDFLKGKKQYLIKRLEERMNNLAGNLLFEEAAKVRDKIAAIRKSLEIQKVVSPELGDIDVIGFYQSDIETIMNIFIVRNGTLIGVKDFHIKDTCHMPYNEVLSAFIEQFYNKELLPPHEILVKERPKGVSILKKWLKVRLGVPVKITVPQSSKSVELLNMAEDNARILYNLKKNRSDKEVTKELAKRLKLSGIPESIGAFDISIISGSDAVGAFIYWKDGKFLKNHYRHLKIKSVTGNDDYGMMRETLFRVSGNFNYTLPDLIVIDGGKGHLETAVRALSDMECDMSGTNIISVAKRPDRVFLPGIRGSVNIEDSSASSLLLKKIRDEVHRFAITYHRNLRSKRLLQSPIEQIKGVSKQRRLELLRRFGSLDGIRNSTVEEIASIKGIGEKLAQDILNSLK